MAIPPVAAVLGFSKRHRLFYLALVSAVVIVLAVVDSANAALPTLTNPNPQGSALFGWSVATGDINGDGAADIIVGTPKEDVGSFADQGRVYVFSGASGSLIRTLNRPISLAGAHFGWSVASADVNGDGRADVVVGAPVFNSPTSNQGRAYAFSGTNGALIHTLLPASPQTGAEFGYSVAAADVGGGAGGAADAKADIIVGARLEDVSAIVDVGRVYVFSGADGSSLYSKNKPGTGIANAQFGSTVAAGDVNNDGKADVVAGAPQEDVGANLRQGKIYIFNGPDGALIRTLEHVEPQSDTYYGGGLAVGKVDADANADIISGAFGHDVAANSDQGRVYILSGSNGSLIRTLDSPNPQAFARFGRALAAADVDGDNKADIIAGAPNENVGSFPDQGRAYVLSGADGSLILTLTTLNLQFFGGFSPEFGWSVAAGDLNNNGKADVAAGAPYEDVDGNTDEGRAYAFLSTDTDSDFIPDSVDNCPNVPNGPAQAGIPGVGNQTNTDAALAAAGWRLGPGVPPPILTSDGLGDACDNDDDNDTFVDANEAIFTTNPRQPCATTGSPNSFPPDVNNDKVVDNNDIVQVLGSTGLAIGQPGYSPRIDLFAPGFVIDLNDTLLVLGFFGWSCSSP